MADSYIQVALDSNGKKLQTFVNTISGSAVHAEAVTLVDQFGAPLGALDVKLPGNQIDLDTGVGSDLHDVIAIGAPGVGGMQIAQISDGYLLVSVPTAADTIAKARFSAAGHNDVGVPALVVNGNGDYELPSLDGDGLLRVTAQKSVGATSLATSQVTSTGTAATIAIARATRRSVCFTNTHASGSVRIGPVTVTAGNGQILGPGESKVFTWVGLYQVIDDGSTHCVVCVADEY